MTGIEIIVGLVVFGVVVLCVLGWAYLAMEAAENAWRTPTFHNRRHLPEVMEPPIYMMPRRSACLAPDEDDVDWDDDDDWGDE